MGHAGVLPVGRKQSAQCGSGWQDKILCCELGKDDSMPYRWGWGGLDWFRIFIAAGDEKASENQGRTKVWRAGHG
jgi:hypothetical protein